MKLKSLFLSLLALALCVLPALAEAEAPGAGEEKVASDVHVLVVFFSHVGENYNVGVIEEGNTAKMGKIIAAKVGADLFELVPVVPYSQVYDQVLQEATEEQRTGARPEYEGEIENWEQYDTVFIGYPIWWGKIPNIVYTFMEAYDFAGKTVIPFNTHEGSGQARTQRDIEEALPDAVALQGLALRGSVAQGDEAATIEAVEKWLGEIGVEIAPPEEENTESEG